MAEIIIETILLCSVQLAIIIQYTIKFLKKNHNKRFNIKKLKMIVAYSIMPFLISIIFVICTGIQLYNFRLFLVELNVVSCVVYKLVDGVIRIRTYQYGLRDYAVGIVTIAISVVIIGLVHKSPNSFNPCIILGIVVMDLLLMYIIVKLQNTRGIEKEYIQLKNQLEAKNQYMDDMKKMDMNIRYIRHDLRKHYDVLSELLEEEKLDEAKKYLKEYTDGVTGNVGQMNSSNGVLDALLNTRISYCKQSNIPLFITVDKNVKKIDDVDICSLVGNLLDNAIEYSMTIPEENRYIELQILRDDHKMRILLQNTILYSVLKENDELKTTKNKINEHGMGTKIVSNIVKKYQGSIDFYEEFDMFVCKVII